MQTKRVAKTVRYPFIMPKNSYLAVFACKKLKFGIYNGVFFCYNIINKGVLCNAITKGGEYARRK